jgi:hypothetical protein
MLLITRMARLKSAPEAPTPTVQAETAQVDVPQGQEKAIRPARSMRRPLVWVSLVSLVLAAVYARVPLLDLNGGVVGGHLDGYNNMWNYYWIKTAIFDLHRNPFFTDYIYYPTGISLRFHTYNPLNGLATMPFNLTLGYIPTFNLIFLVAPVLTAIFSFLLIRDLVGNPWAAFAGAVVATYTDYHITVFLAVGQSNMITLQWMPLYLFFLFRALHGRPTWGPDDNLVGRDTRRWPVYMVLAILMLLFTTLTDWQYLMFIVFVTMLYGAFVLFTRRPRREKAHIFARLAGIGGIYAAIVTPPLLLPMIREAAESPWLDVSYQSVQHSVDIGWLANPGMGLHGLLILGLAVVGIWTAFRQGGRTRETGIFWLLVVAFFYVMSLGPVVLLNGVETGIPGLYALMQNLPVISSGRDPARFSLIATMGVGVLVAFGFRFLLWWLAKLRPTPLRWARAIPAALLALFVLLSTGKVMAESGDARISPPDWPDFYRQIAQDEETYAILELPLFSEAGRGPDHYQMYQALHHKPRYSGRLARDRKLDNPNNFVKHASLFRHLWMLEFPRSWTDLYYPERDFLQRTDYATHGIPILNYYNTPYIILYKEAITPENWARMEEVIKQVLGEDAKPYYEDRLMRVYRVPAVPPPSNPLTLDVGEGWHTAETGLDGKVYRWADNTVVVTRSGYVIKPTAQLYTMNLSGEPVRAVLNFTAYPYKEPRTLKVTINGYEAANIQLRPEDGPKPVSLELTVPPGNNLLDFTSPEPPLPTDNPQADARQLSFALQDVSLRLK